MKYSNPLAIVFVSQLLLLSLTDGRYTTGLKNCVEFKEIIYEDKIETVCGQANKEKVCEFHWVEVPGGGKKWEEDKSRCKYAEVGAGNCKREHRRVPRTVKRMMSKGEAPCFTQMGKSDNGVPKIEMNLPNGANETLMLGKFLGMEGSFIGSLLNEDGAMVAMSEMPDAREMTVLSFRSGNSSQFRWMKNGDTEIMPANRIVDDPIFPKFGNPKYGQNDHYGQNSYEKDDDSDDGYGYGRKKRQAENIGDLSDKAHIVKLAFGFSNEFKNLLDEENRNDLRRAVRIFMPHVQARYCAQSLDTKILFTWSEDKESFNDVRNFGINSFDLNSLQSTTVDILDRSKSDLVVYIGGGQEGGLAQVGSICETSNRIIDGNGNRVNPDGLKHSISDYCPRCDGIVGLGGLLAHEIGHNLGMSHDHDRKNGGNGTAPYPEPKDGSPNPGIPFPENPCDEPGTVMGYSNLDFHTAYKWSDCSNRNFESHFNKISSNGGWCLPSATAETAKLWCRGALDKNDEDTIRDIMRISNGNTLG